MKAACRPRSRPRRNRREDSTRGGRFCDQAKDRPIRICIISPLGYGLYHPESGQPFGGAEVQLFLLARELSTDPTFQVVVLATVNGAEGVEQVGKVRLMRRVGRKRLGPDGRGTMRGFVAAFIDMYRTLRAVGADVYLHAGAGVEVGAYALICRLLRRRFVFCVASTGDAAVRPPNVCGPLSWLYPLGLRLSDGIVVRTEDQRAMLHDRFGCESALIRTGHALPVQEPAPLKSAILWVGRLHPLKQPGLFLDLAERLPHARFIMVGMRDDTQAALHAHIRRRVAGLSNVTFAEDVPWKDIDRVFAGATLFVNTSTYEGFPNTFVQAALHSLPIVSWAVDPDQVLSRHRIGFCCAEMFERLVEATQDLWGNESLRLETGRRAAAYARGYHDLSRMTAQFKSLIRTMIACR